MTRILDSDLTPFEASLDAINEDFERQQQVQKASILGSAVELDHVLRQVEPKTRLAVIKLVLNLADAGFELGNPHCHKDLPDQTREMVIELAQAVEKAIEEFLDES